MSECGKVLITGGGGLIGGRLAKELLERGCEVMVLDSARMSAGSLPVVEALGAPGLGYVQGSVMDDQVWAMLPRNFTHIVHAAALVGVEREPREQIAAMDVNLIGTRMCLQFAGEQTRLERFVYLSASEIYGVSAVDVCEDDAANIKTQGTHWGYAASKLNCEFYVKAFAERLGMDYGIVRPFNVYGPAPTCRSAIVQIVRQAVTNAAVSISRTGEHTRSWCHVRDCVDGLIECLFREEARNQTFNLGNDQTEVSVLQLVRLICDRVRSQSPVVVCGGEAPEVVARRPNLKKARDLLGFSPHISLEDGVDDVARWSRRSCESESPMDFALKSA